MSSSLRRADSDIRLGRLDAARFLQSREQAGHTRNFIDLVQQIALRLDSNALNSEGAATALQAISQEFLVRLTAREMPSPDVGVTATPQVVATPQASAVAENDHAEFVRAQLLQTENDLPGQIECTRCHVMFSEHLEDCPECQPRVEERYCAVCDTPISDEHEIYCPNCFDE